MMKAHIQNTVVVGIYPDSTEVPKEQSAVSLDGLIVQPSLGWVYENNTFHEPEIKARPAPSIAELIEVSCNILDSEASVIRNATIGEVAHQFQIYTAKYQDARAFKLKAFGADVSEYRWIAAECAASGNNPETVANVFISRYEAMLVKLTQCEEYRVYGKATLRVATTVEEVREVCKLVVPQIRSLLD